MKSLLPLLALALTGLSCRVIPHAGSPESDLKVPETWTAPDAGSSLDPNQTWWSTFEDPALSAAIEAALESNLDLRGSAARLRQAAAQARIAGADRVPSLSAGVSGSRAKSIFVGLPVPGGDVLESTSTSVGVSLNASWELDLWGRLAAQEEAAATRFAAAAGDYRAARHSIAAQTAKVWFAWMELRSQQDLARESTGTFQRTLELTQSRFENGIASAFEVRLASSNLATARAIEAVRDEEVERVVRQLEILQGRYPSGMLTSTAELPGLPERPQAGLPGELVARRPDLAAAELRILAANDDLYGARALLYPRVTLNGSLGRTSNSASDLTDPDFSVWSLAGGLAMPIFEGGRLRNNVDLKEAQVQEALAHFEAALLNAFGEVEIALVAEDRLAIIEERFQSLREETRAARELAEERYRAGLVDLFEVLDTQRRELSARSELISVQARRRTQRVDLHLALGGNFGAAPEATNESTEGTGQ
ncbi:MAG: multidrug efflux system outer membrane protein [Planctomycetota bacterium]|jgi:multidrug efflux system outer membrane protein